MFVVLDRESVQDMAFQEHLGISYISEKQEKLLKKTNRKIIRNYILCAVLGGLVGVGIVKAPEVKGAVCHVANSFKTQLSNEK